MNSSQVNDSPSDCQVRIDDLDSRFRTALPALPIPEGFRAIGLKILTTAAAERTVKLRLLCVSSGGADPQILSIDVSLDAMDGSTDKWLRMIFHKLNSNCRESGSDISPQLEK